jgi:SynChlorMet cassette protein ScmC
LVISSVLKEALSGDFMIDEIGHLMRLGDGQRWHIWACEDLRHWVEKLASIMQLEISKPNGYPKLIFIRKQPANNNVFKPLCRQEENLERELFRSGWRARDIEEMQLWSRSDAKSVICAIVSGDENLEVLMMRHSLFPIYQRTQDSGGLPLHAALVERNGKGILLSAPANTGKSTCCRRLPSPWRALCDEETLIVRAGKKRYLAHPFPTWSDHLWRRSKKTWNVEKHVPLSAIFFLKQAGTDQVVGMGQGEAAVCIYRTAMQVLRRSWSYLNRQEVESYKLKLFDNACELAISVPAFKLRVSLEGRFWEEIEKVLV